MNLKELYQEIILDHGKNPRNKGKCNGYTNDAKAHNPLCGDKVHIYLKLNKYKDCLLYTSPSPRDKRQSRMPSSA